ncbi:copper amine oxidase [Pedobacter sp. BS3]|uniref:copper amine oxidase n=1 Tax=Pedobacter sp. BS3 TaxID=2567937 RepID=UPI0011ED6FB6|nr:copper amine oxidase [Pedobacter sp. BS3]TZF81826.1 copper amine oxidase [Pedobacter sp. BS3]
MKKLAVCCVFTIAACAFVQAQNLSPEQNQALIKTKQGSIVELPGLLSEDLPSIPYHKIVLPGPQYIISDDPEYIRVPEGIALKEVVQPGRVRLYTYNVNGVKEPEKMDRKITTVIKNLGSGDLHIRMLKYASQKPSANYFQIGKQGLADYFASQGDKKIRTVKAGEAVPLDEKLEKNIVKYDELVHGFYEFVIDQPAEIYVLQTDPKTYGPDALKKNISVLPPKSKSGAGRGLYGISNYKVLTDNILDTKNGITALVLADGKTDNWVTGFEGTTGQQSKLVGNYGVMYNIELKWKSSDGKGLALVTWNARSANSQWCNGMAATMVIDKGIYNGGIVKLPSDRLTTKGAPEAVVVQVFKPAGGEEQTIHITYSPPGASCLPTPLIFIPVDLK